MIQVTLQFSSIAAAVAALAKIPEADAAFATTAAAAPAAPGKPQPATKPVKSPAPTQEGAGTPSTAQASGASTQKSDAASSTTPPAPAPAANPQGGSLDYAVLQKAVFELVGLVKAAGNDPQTEVLGIACELAGKQGVTFKEVPSEHWQTALDRVNAKIAEYKVA